MIVTKFNLLDDLILKHKVTLDHGSKNYLFILISRDIYIYIYMHIYAYIVINCYEILMDIFDPV